MRSLTSRDTAPRLGLVAASLAAVVLTTAVPRPALALNGLYTMFGVGYGKFNGDKLVLEESGAGNDLPLTGEGCCAKGGLAAQFRLGLSIFGFAGEFAIIGNGWDLGSDTGGGGIIGGGLRFYPLTIMQLGGMDTADFPLDVSLGAMLGYALVGKNFAYTGSALDFDILVEYKLASFLNVGLKLDLGIPSFSDFVYTDYKNNVGRCLDAQADQVVTGDNVGRFNKDDASHAPCNGAGPSTTLVSPQLVFTFHFDVLE